MNVYDMKSKILILVLSTFNLLGCSAAKTAMTKQDLVVESHVSHSVVLEPLSPENRVVYIRVKDLSGNEMRKPMTTHLKKTLSDEGIHITNDPKQANLMLNAFVISAKKTNKEEINSFLNSGYKGGAEGLLTAAAIGGVFGSRGSDLGVVALGGAAVGFLADTLVSDDYYTFVVDIELRERPLDGDNITNNKASKSIKASSSQNTLSATVSNSNVERGENYKWITYETRIISTANQMNLDIESAKPLVMSKAASTLAEFLL